MSLFSDRTGTAVLVIDTQIDVMDGAYDVPGVTRAIRRVVDAADSAAVPVVWIQHSDEEMPRGSERWQVIPELEQPADARVVHKEYGDSFEGTDLEEVLAGLGVERLVVAGAMTDACIRSTIHGALTRGYDVTLVGDAHTTVDRTDSGGPTAAGVIAHTNMYWGYQGAPGRKASVVASSDVTFA